jgi:hypothetical protein
MYQWQRRIQEHLGYDAGVIGDNTFNVLLGITDKWDNTDNISSFGAKLFVNVVRQHDDDPASRNFALARVVALVYS